MKNKIIIFLTIIFSFILTDKVSALSEERTTDYVLDFNNPMFDSIFNENNQNFYSYYSLDDILNKFYSIFNEHKNDYPYYVISMYYGSSTKLLISMSLFDELPIIRQFGYVSSKSSSGFNLTYGYVTFHYTGTVLSGYSIFGSNYPNSVNNFSFSSFNTVDYSSRGDYFNEITSSSSNSNLFLDSYTIYSEQFIFDSNINIKKENVFGSATDVNFKLDNYYYEHRDIFPFFKQKYSKKPIITTNIENTLYNDDNEPIQKKITVDYGIYDFDKYKYEYSSYGISDKNSSDGLFWLPYLNSTPFEFYVNNNDTYFFRVTDKNTGDYVTSSSITVAGIVENLPYIVFENLKDDECVLNYYNDFYFTCDLVKLYAKNIDYSKYSLQYSYDKTNWVNHNNYYSSEIYIRDNATLYARIIDLTTNDIVDTLSYTVTHLTFPNSNLPIIKITTDCVDNVVGASIKVNLYNYDRDKYKLLYKVYDNTEFLETNVVVDGNNFYKYFTLSKETVLYIKIVDVDNNYITGTSFTYTGNLCKKDNLDINNIDDINDLILDKDSSSNQLFSQILNICYTSAPRRLVIFLKLFLILTLIGAVLYLVGWK